MKYNNKNYNTRFVRLVLFICSLGLNGAERAEIDEIELHRIVTEGQKNVANAKGRDIVLILGDAQIGKSTIANFIYGCNYTKEKNEHLGEMVLRLTDPNAPEPAKRGGDGVSQTVFPEVYETSGYPVFLCDCPGFAGTENSTIKIAQSILIEMMVSSARSVRVVAMFKDSETAASSGIGRGMTGLANTLNQIMSFKSESLGEKIASVGEKIASVLSTPSSLFSDKKSGPLLFICNNHSSNTLKQEQIVARLLKLRENHKKKFIDEVGRIFKSDSEMKEIANKLFSITVPQLSNAESDGIKHKMEEIRNHPQLKEQVANIESSWLLDTVSENSLVVVNNFEYTTRQKIREYIRDMPIIEKDRFSFTGYSSDRNIFDGMLIKHYLKSTHLIQAVFSVKQYEKMLLNLIESIKGSIEMNKRNINYSEALLRGEKEAEENQKQARIVAISDIPIKIEANVREIQEKKRQLEKVSKEIKDCERTDEVKHWEESFSKIAYFWGGPWYPKYNVIYSGVPYDRVSEPLASGAVRYRVDSIDYAAGRFDVVYEAPGVFKDCRGSVEIYVQHCKLRETRDRKIRALENLNSLVKVIASLELKMKRDQELLAELSSEITRTTPQTQIEIQAIIDRYKREKRENEAKEKLYQGLLSKTTDVQKVYEDSRESIDQCYRVCQMLTLNRKIEMIKFMEIYEGVKDLAGESEELPDGLYDPVTCAVLLDPVLTKCGHVFNRITVDDCLNTGNVYCPLCRARLELGDIRKMSLDSFIDEHVGKIVNATNEAQGLSIIDKLFE